MRRRALFIPPLKGEGGRPDPRESGGQAAGWGELCSVGPRFGPHPARCARHPRIKSGAGSPPAGEGVAKLRRREFIFTLAGAAAWPLRLLRARRERPGRLPSGLLGRVRREWTAF